MLIIGQSLWSLIKPDTAGILHSCILLFVVALYNLVVSFFRGSGSGNSDGSVNWFPLLLGLLQLWMAYTYYGLYQKRKPLNITRPDSAQIQLYDELCTLLNSMKLSSSDDPDYFEARSQGKWLQGFLLRDRVILAKRDGSPEWIMLANTPEVDFTPARQAGIGRHQVSGGAASHLLLPFTGMENGLCCEINSNSVQVFDFVLSSEQRRNCYGIFAVFGIAMTAHTTRIGTAGDTL